MIGGVSKAILPTMATQKLADWISKLTPEAIPSSVKEAAVHSFANYIGCAFGGFDHEATQQLLRSYQFLPQAPGSCTVLGGKQKVDPLQAALVNCFAAHLHDYDDTHLATVIHPTAAVASGLLAYTDSRSSQGHQTSGEDFICALVAGMEVECLLGISVYPSHYDIGWHITGTVGSIGAAIAIGKAMGLSPPQLVNAISIAAAQVCGMRRHFGSHAKPLGVAFAAQAGLQSAILAHGGMTAANDSIEGPRGWIECVCPDKGKAKEELDSFVTALVS
jgi:aconitate decarboxylase